MAGFRRHAGRAAVLIAAFFVSAPIQAQNCVISGGINNGSITQNCLFNGPQRLTFQPAIADELIRRLPAGKPIAVEGVGSQVDWAIAGQYAQYLKDKGFNVEFGLTGILSPPPSSKINIQPAGDGFRIIIAPSAF
jgi:hypothetical protein